MNPDAATDPALADAVIPSLGLFGTTPTVTIVLTLIFMGGCAVMTGRGLAGTWRPLWQVAPYALLLGAADRFLIYALFDGQLLSVTGFILDTLILLAIAALSHQGTKARRMVSQYPWLYESAWGVGWRKRDHIP
jgi:hypothetical protein